MSKFSPYPKKKYSKKENIEKIISKDACYLIIVESPSKCKKIEDFLGKKYTCIASKGHIREIKGLKSIDSKHDFKTEYTIIEEKKTHIESMQKIIAKFPKENIILATDDDREGEGIAWHICQTFELDVATTKRIIFREITEKAIVTAVANPTIINMPLVYAQQARQILDMIVGYKISPILWKYLYSNKNNALSAGRCQTPALRLIYERELEESKKEVKYIYKTSGTFFSNNQVFELTKDFEKEEELLDFLEKSKEFKYHLSISEKKNHEKNPPKPFNTSNLLQKASNLLGMSPKETTTLCQQLYQDGHITYIRTDSMKYSPVFINEAKKYMIENLKLQESYIGNTCEIENKDETNPHEAIRVTHIENDTINTDNHRMHSLYKLIWRNTIQSCMSIYRYSVEKVIITAPLQLKYVKEIEIPLFLGWKKINEKADFTKEQNEGSSLLYFFKSIQQTNQPFSHNSIQSTLHIRDTEKHYTESTLIKQLEDLGIGRPSTYAFIVNTIQERDYVKRTDIEGTKKNVNEYTLYHKEIITKPCEKIFGASKNKLVIQPLGILTCEFLIKHFQHLFSYQYTKDLEIELDKIANHNENGKPWYEVCRKCKDEIKDLIKNTKIEKLQYKIDDSHIFVYEKYGPVIKEIKKDNGEQIEKEESEEKKEKEKNKYMPVKKEIKIDLEKLKSGSYDLEELIESTFQTKSLGKYENEELYLKNGKYDWYVEWGSNKKSIKNIQKEMNKKLDELTLEDVLRFLEKEEKQEKNNNILRELTPNLSIRKGKFGAYVYYKKSNMKKPEFLNIKKFKGSFLQCEKETIINWINENYKMNETIENVK